MIMTNPKKDWGIWLMAIAAILIFSYLWAVGSAGAQGSRQCGNYTALAEGLQNKYNEYKAGQGITKSGQAVLELFRSSEGELTWTIVMKTPSGMACIMASGVGWYTVPPVPTPRPDPSDPA